MLKDFIVSATVFNLMAILYILFTFDKDTKKLKEELDGNRSYFEEQDRLWDWIMNRVGRDGSISKRLSRLEEIALDNLPHLESFIYDEGLYSQELRVKSTEFVEVGEYAVTTDEIYGSKRIVKLHSLVKVLFDDDGKAEEYHYRVKVGL